MTAVPSNPTRVALDELIALSARRARREPRAQPAQRGDCAPAAPSRWRGRGVDFRESRIYQPGDEIRHMDWRVTARSGKPHTKVFQEEREQGLLLVIDLESRHALRHARALQERAGGARRGVARVDGIAVPAIASARSASAAASTARSSRPAVGAACCACCARCATGTQPPTAPAQQPLSRALARVRRLLRPGMRLILLSDGFSTDADAAQRLPQLAAPPRDRRWCCCAMRWNSHAPPPGRYALHLGATRRVLDFGDAAVRERVDRTLRRRARAPARDCRKLGVRVIELDTHADLRRALAPLLARSRQSAIVA